MKSLKLALDWTPNVNHIGFFVARELGHYSERDLEVTILDPSSDDYGTTPAKKVETGEADLALCPTESLISYRTKGTPFELIGIAALLQEDLSAIAVKAGGGIASPKDLDGKTYASYRARYEDEFVRWMIRNDGGRGAPAIEYPEKLGIWDTVVDGIFDATWIFLNWEGVEAEAAGLDLRYFKLKDYGIPYSYSPVLAVGKESLAANGDTYRDFVAATKEGYLFVQREPDRAVGILGQYVPERDRDFPLRQALAQTAPYFGDDDTWGRMDERRVSEFLEWVYTHDLEKQRLTASELVSDALLASVA